VRGAYMSDLVYWAPDARIAALFGSFPARSTAHAGDIGFCSDGNLGRPIRLVQDPQLPGQGVVFASHTP